MQYCQYFFVGITMRIPNIQFTIIVMTNIFRYTFIKYDTAAYYFNIIKIIYKQSSLLKTFLHVQRNCILSYIFFSKFNVYSHTSTQRYLQAPSLSFSLFYSPALLKIYDVYIIHIHAHAAAQKDHFIWSCLLCIHLT